MDMSQLNKGIDYGLFEKILNNTDFTKPELSALDCCRIVYEKTFMVYALKYWETKAECERLEERMIDKVGVISDFETKIKQLEDRIVSLGGSLSEGGEEKTGEDSEALLLCKGSEES